MAVLILSNGSRIEVICTTGVTLLTPRAMGFGKSRATSKDGQLRSGWLPLLRRAKTKISAPSSYRLITLRLHASNRQSSERRAPDRGPNGSIQTDSAVNQGLVPQPSAGFQRDRSRSPTFYRFILQGS